MGQDTLVYIAVGYLGYFWEAGWVGCGVGGCGLAGVVRCWRLGVDLIFVGRGSVVVVFVGCFLSFTFLCRLYIIVECCALG